MTSAWPWSMGVRDYMNRQRPLTVRIEGDEIIVEVPWPGMARITGPQMAEYIAIMRAARDQVFRQDAP